MKKKKFSQNFFEKKIKFSQNLFLKKIKKIFFFSKMKKNAKEIIGIYDTIINKNRFCVKIENQKFMFSILKLVIKKNSITFLAINFI